MGTRVGKHTVAMSSKPSVKAFASIVGPKEGEGPLRHCFDLILEDEMWGEDSWEKAESKLVREAFVKALQKSDLSANELNYIVAGDLLNQCIAANYGLRESQLPFIGVYGACSTMAESMSVGSMLIDGGFAKNIACITSSHFCSAEKQFRFPLEYGSQRPPTAQWTVTGSGAVILSDDAYGPVIKYITTGRIVDKGIKDANNMGAAMAPAAADTLEMHFKETGLKPDYYDLIVTGDLGKLGKDICMQLLEEKGYNMGDIYNDCGVMIFDLKKQKVDCGGSGCGCSASVLTGYIFDEMINHKYKKVLFVATGALLSTTSIQQGESIPCIAHAVSFEAQ